MIEPVEERSATSGAPRIVVFGEGDAEEGTLFRNPPFPGDEIHRSHQGALHILVSRILYEKSGSMPTIVWSPRLRTGRREGNPGLLMDLEGRPRIRRGEHREVRPLIGLCIGDCSVDLAVVVKDARHQNSYSATLDSLRQALANNPGEPTVIVAAAIPSIEAWLIPIPETEALDERAAKARWNSELGRDRLDDRIRRAEQVELVEVIGACPDGFGGLVRDLRGWWDSRANRISDR